MVCSGGWPAPFYHVGGLSHVQIHTLTFANHRCSTPDPCEIEVDSAVSQGALVWSDEGLGLVPRAFSGNDRILITALVSGGSLPPLAGATVEHIYDY